MPTFQYHSDNTNSIEMIEYDDGTVNLFIDSNIDEDIFQETMCLSEGSLIPEIVLKPLVIGEFVESEDETYQNWQSLADRIGTSGTLDETVAREITTFLEKTEMDESQLNALSDLAEKTDWENYL